MTTPIPYYKNLTESFQSINLESTNADFELIKFETIPIDDSNKLRDKPFRLNAFAVALVLGGKGQLTINSGNYTLKPGMLYFTTPWHIRQYSGVEDWKGYMVCFTPQFLFLHRQSESILKEFPFFHSENGWAMDLDETQLPIIQNAFQEIDKTLQQPTNDTYKVLFHRLNILLYTCKLIAASEIEHINHDGLLNTFIQLLNTYFIKLNKGEVQEELSLRTMAAQMHLHPNYLSNLLKAQTGKSAAHIIRERVALEAQAFLKNTDMTVAEIAYYLQFKDTSNFAKFFKGITGVSPTVFRSEQRSFA